MYVWNTFVIDIIVLIVIDAYYQSIVFDIISDFEIYFIFMTSLFFVFPDKYEKNDNEINGANKNFHNIFCINHN